MKYNHLFVLIILVLIIFLVPIILFIFSFNSVAFNEDFYNKEFQKYGVYGNLKNYDIEKINRDVLYHLKFQENNGLIENDFFNEREKWHLLDVKNLVQKIFFIYKFSVFLFLFLFFLLCLHFNLEFKKIMKKFLFMLLFGNFLVLIVGILLFFLWNLNFYFIFGTFHGIFFTEGTYSFNPDFEKIVVLYPENLFFDALTQIFLKTILSSVIFIFLILIVYWRFFNAEFSKIFSKIFVVKAKK